MTLKNNSNNDIRTALTSEVTARTDDMVVEEVDETSIETFQTDLATASIRNPNAVEIGIAMAVFFRTKISSY
ncbi:hypothetical protein ACFQJ7_12900 [Halovenus rubra]|uniref:Uncharacterized protein n=2 Tax=Halovenus rubra TaxID=869890 RepID=A0ACC7E1N9_9EURY|nr:hypothetical protein [Halovenus rubra]